MTLFDAILAGAAFGVALWSLAARVAQARGLPLGRFPLWLPAACGAGAAGSALLVPPDAALAVGAALIGAIVCGLVDARTGLIFDALSLPVALTAAAAAAVEHRLTGALLAAVVIGGALLLLYGLTGRRGIGLGDVKLGAAVGLGYGLQTGLTAIGSAFVLGAAYAVVLIATGRARRSDTLRFGPFIAGGAALSLGSGLLGWRG